MAQFRTKARAVELLGKGQISDLPTAISELWKNGYDAYGDKLEAFLYQNGYENLESPLFVLSDDGKGMTRNDILDKWIVLGTDSKSRGDVDIRGEETLWKAPRIKMGEKGIGRLSVSYLGSQMLMLTKKIGSPVQAVFFDWRILTNYNLYLEDINIPIKDVHTVDEFASVFEELKTEYLSNFKIYDKPIDDPWHEQSELRDVIVNSCSNLSLPAFIIEEVLVNLIGDGNDVHGTKFIIFNPDSQLSLLQKADKVKDDDEDYSTIYHIRSSLLGLFNVFKSEEQEYETHFWIVNESGRFDFIEKREFFKPEDFDVCDHLISGQFDQNGEFDGAIRIFEKTIPHKFKVNRVLYHNQTSYGPLSIKLGYLQGNVETPILKGTERDIFEDKLLNYGGLYIYRDGFRVLPYGRVNQDFLEFEYGRSKKAGRYFFSHRRMFGYLEISRNANSKLIDKAGREGFISNQAYRDFVTDLKAFFYDLAITYFGDEAKDTTKRDFQEKYQELSQNEKLEKEREKRDRNEFRKQLTQAPKDLTNIEQRYNQLVELLKTKLGQNSITYQEISEILKQIEECKIAAQRLELKKPIRYKLTEIQKLNFHDYAEKHKSFMSTVNSNNATLVTQAHERLKEQELLNEFNNRSKQYRNSLENSFDEYGEVIYKNVERLKAISDSEKNKFLSEYDSKLTAIIPKAVNRREIKNSIALLEKVYADIKYRADERIKPFLNHISIISPDVNEDDLMGYYKLKFDEVKEELIQSRELAQLGIAVEIIDHEFNILYSQLSETINSSKDEMSPKKFKMLVTAFEHLENNYKLLQPLYRTTGRIRQEVTGEELYEYGEQFFKNKFHESKITYRITALGAAYKANTYESIFKAVLINILNNAIYWMRKSEIRIIEIDAAGDKLIIRNSGEPIHSALLNDIFGMFYSKRPEGRGIGLYLAKQSLNKLGYTIYATNETEYNKLSGACFVIEPLNNIDE